LSAACAVTAPVMIDAAHARRVVGLLEAAGLVVWPDGGWAWSHSSASIAAHIGTLTWSSPGMTGPPYGPWPPPRSLPRSDRCPGVPARLILIFGDGRQIDLDLVIFDRHASGWQDLSARRLGDYPAEAEQHQRGRRPVGGCAPPALRIWHHLGHTMRPTRPA
jgi:hypothetical protein